MIISSVSLASTVIHNSNNGNNEKWKRYRLYKAWESWHTPTSEYAVLEQGTKGVKGMWRYLSRARYSTCICGKFCLNILYCKNQVETLNFFLNPCEMLACTYAGKGVAKMCTASPARAFLQYEAGSSTPQHMILTWLCRLGSWGLLGLTLADLCLCWARGILGSPGTRIHSQHQQIYKSAWKGPWRVLSAFPSLLHHFWCPQCLPVGSGNVCYLGAVWWWHGEGDDYSFSSASLFYLAPWAGLSLRWSVWEALPFWRGKMFMMKFTIPVSEPDWTSSGIHSF